MTARRFFRTLLHFFVIILTGSLLLLLVLTGAAYYLAVSDQEKVPELIDQTCRESIGAEVHFEHYHFQYLAHFPFLSLAIEDLVIQDPDSPDGTPALMRVGKVSILFRPWKLLRNELVVKSVQIDSAQVRLYRASDGAFNAAFLSNRPRQPQERFRFELLSSVDKIVLSNLSFDFLDSLHGKHHQIDLLETFVTFESGDDQKEVRMQGNWFFHGLMFKFENGPFLRDKAASVDLRFAFDRQLDRISLLPSSLRIDPADYQLEGYFLTNDPGYLRLEVHNEGVLFSNAREILSDNLRRALKPYAIDQPIQTILLIEGSTLPNQPQPLRIRFAVNQATVASPSLRFSQTSFSGTYFNQCDSTGRITPHTDCLTLENFAGLLFDTIPILGTYHARDLTDPLVDVSGAACFPLADINSFLPGEQLRAREGEAEVNFSYSGHPRELLDPLLPNPEMQVDGQLTLRNASFTYLPRQMDFHNINASAQFDERDLRMDDVRFQFNQTPYHLTGDLREFIPVFLKKKNRLQLRIYLKTSHLDLDDFLSPSNDAPSAANAGEPVAQLLSRISSRLAIDLQVRTDTLTYRKLRVRNANFGVRLRRACSAGEGPCLWIDNFRGLIYQQIPLEGSLHLDRPEDPRITMDLRINSGLPAFNRLFPPGGLQFNEGQIDLELHYQGRLLDYLSLGPTILDNHLRGAVTLQGASIDLPNGAYRLRQANGRFHFDESDLRVDTLSADLNQTQIRAKGQITGFLPFLFRPDRPLATSLEVYTPELDLSRLYPGSDVRTQSASNRFQTNRIARVVEAAINRTEGNLRVRADHLKFRHIELAQVAFRTQLSRRCEKQPGGGGCAVIDSLSAILFKVVPLRAQLTVSDFNDPYFSAEAAVEMPLRDLNRMLSPDKLRFGDGLIRVLFHYQGRPAEQLLPGEVPRRTTLHGDVQISAGALDYPSRGYRFREIDGTLSFDEKDLVFKEMGLRINQNLLRINGRIIDFLPFLFSADDRLLTADLRIHSPSFNFGRFRAPRNFQVPEENGPVDPTVITRITESSLRNIKARLDLSFDEVLYRHFSASDITGKLTMTPDQLHFDQVNMQLAGGRFKIDGALSDLARNTPDLDLKVSFHQTDISQIFQAFDNFGQHDLTHENIRGRLTADVRFKAKANENYDVLPASLDGDFDLKVDDGELIELPGLINMNGFIFKNRNMAEVKFATLENTFQLNGQELQIDHFRVLSSALTFGVEGRYSLGTDGQTNLLFEVPIANLFRKDLNEKALENLQDRGLGLSVLLRATEDNDGSLNFRWVFSRKRKD